MASPPPTTAKLSLFDRLLILFGFLATTSVTSYFAFVSQDRAAECQSIRTQRLSDVDRFRAVAVQFEPLVRTYMGDALHSRDTKASKVAVVANLNEQRARLAFVEPYLSAEDKEKASRFTKAAENFIVEADKSLPVSKSARCIRS